MRRGGAEVTMGQEMSSRGFDLNSQVTRRHHPSAAGCPSCGELVDINSPYVSAKLGVVHIYCSSECRDRGPRGHTETQLDLVRVPSASSKRSRWFVGLLAGALLAPCATSHPTVRQSPDVATLVDLPTRAPATTAPRQPSEYERATALAASLSFDTWVHPLAGPERHMPVRTSRAFGASRPGHRPGECESGHCGLDLGGDVWGEAVYAVHDGVVVKVNATRPNASGGYYVKLAHRGGTVFTQYFHLAAIPKRVRPGVFVRTGQVVGLLGETGVDHSGPHLHFAVSVQPTPDSQEIYIDPEPLVALWPLVVPRAVGGPGTATTPGVPVSALRSHQRSLRLRKRRAQAGSNPQVSADRASDVAKERSIGGADAEPNGGTNADPLSLDLSVQDSPSP